MKEVYLIRVWSSNDEATRVLLRTIRESAWDDEEAMAFDNIYRTNDEQVIEIFKLLRSF